MSLLIDGYNLLHVTGIFGRGIGPGTLERSRRALLNFLAASIDPAELPRTTVVFDAAGAPPGLPKNEKHGEITVLYARHEEADTLIEQLIAEDSSPRRLTVVSSDHRLQRAARRRRAKSIDSDRWYAELVETRRRRQQRASPPPTKPDAPLSEAEVEFWLAEFEEE